MGCLQACSQMWSAQEAPSGESFGGLGTQSKPPALAYCLPSQGHLLWTGVGAGGMQPPGHRLMAKVLWPSAWPCLA